MSIEDVIKQEEGKLQSEIDILEEKVIKWVEGMVSDVESDRREFPRENEIPFGKDLGINILMTFKDFEFEQLETLQELSNKLLKLWEMKNEDKRFGRKI